MGTTASGNCSSDFPLLSFTAAESKVHFFSPLCTFFHNDIKALLSPRRLEIDSTITFIMYCKKVHLKNHIALLPRVGDDIAIRADQSPHWCHHPLQQQQRSAELSPHPWVLLSLPGRLLLLSWNGVLRLQVNKPSCVTPPGWPLTSGFNSLQIVCLAHRTLAFPHRFKESDPLIFRR